jgi:hypothetical protein
MEPPSNKTPNTEEPNKPRGKRVPTPNDRSERSNGSTERNASKRQQRAYIPKEIQQISRQVFGRSHLGKKHHKGTVENEYGIVEKWENTGVEYLVDTTTYATKMNHQAPKVYVSQDKNIKLLLALTEMQQFKKDDKEARCEFTLSDYARMRGYSDEEIARGGKFMDELRRDLLSGAYTAFQVPITTKDGKKYIRHGTFYTLDEPTVRKQEWVVTWSGAYAPAVLEVLNGNSRQFFTHHIQEISDRTTTEKPFLHTFYNYLVFSRVDGKRSNCGMPISVRNLLTQEMGVGADTLKRPKGCYDVLCECITYTSTHYPNELSSLILLNHRRDREYAFQKADALSSLDYDDFKKIMEGAVGEDDIRDCYISFCRTDKSKAVTAGSGSTVRLREEVLDWVENWEKVSEYPLKFGRADREQFLDYAINILGTDKVRDLFNREANGYKPNAYKLLVETLPAEAKKGKKNSEPDPVKEDTLKKLEEARRIMMDRMKM